MLDAERCACQIAPKKHKRTPNGKTIIAPLFGAFSSSRPERLNMKCASDVSSFHALRSCSCSFFSVISMPNCMVGRREEVSGLCANVRGSVGASLCRRRWLCVCVCGRACGSAKSLRSLNCLASLFYHLRNCLHVFS